MVWWQESQKPRWWSRAVVGSNSKIDTEIDHCLPVQGEREQAWVGKSAIFGCVWQWRQPNPEGGERGKVQKLLKFLIWLGMRLLIG